MRPDAPTPLLGGLSPLQFMRKHWHKKPLLVRKAWTGQSPIGRAELFELAARDDVESRLITRTDGKWTLSQGPTRRRNLPKVTAPNWTLLVQGVDLHCQAAHELLHAFQFVPYARLDDAMVSWASDGGGVGPHLDSYDVFLLQIAGRRRWRIGRVEQPLLNPDAPLKILTNFVAEEEWLLEPGDMLYLPPLWAHDGVAEGECMTFSVGFRAPTQSELARDLLQHLADAAADASHEDSPRYVDPGQAATQTPARIPARMHAFAVRALSEELRRPNALARALGEMLSEPKPNVWFEAGDSLATRGPLRLSPKTRMLYDESHVFINGEAFQADGIDAQLMRQLADSRALSASARARLSAPARKLLNEWAQAGWVEPGVVKTRR